MRLSGDSGSEYVVI